VALSDPEVAVLARQAVDLLDADVDVRLEPQASHDPYGLGAHAWLVTPVIDRLPHFGIYVYSGMTPAQALAHLIDGLGENVSEAGRFWGRAFPPCPQHTHPARVEEDGESVVLRCPSTGEIVERIAPAL
jgi:hypothetical protein